MSLPKLYKYAFTLRVTAPNGPKMTLHGDVYDVEGYPDSANEQVKDVCALSVGPRSMYDAAQITLRKNRNPVQRIKIVREPPGMDGIECCVFCRQKTRYWNKKTNKPVCPECATTHAPEELAEAKK